MTTEAKKKVDFSGLKKFFTSLIAFFGRILPFAFKTKDSNADLIKSRFLNRIGAVKTVTVDFIVPVKFFWVDDNKVSYDVTAKNCQLFGSDGKKYLLLTSKDGEPITLEISVSDLRNKVSSGHLSVISFVA